MIVRCVVRVQMLVWEDEGDTHFRSVVMRGLTPNRRIVKIGATAECGMNSPNTPRLSSHNEREDCARTQAVVVQLMARVWLVESDRA